MPSSPLGIEGITEEDEAYHGSRFADVEAALFSNPYQNAWAAPGEPALPIYKVTFADVLRGLLPFGKDYAFRKATERAVDSAADLRWGSDDARGIAACCIQTGFASPVNGRSRSPRPIRAIFP